MLLEHLLSNPVFRHARVIAGGEGLLRQVQNVNIMDAPDIIHFLRPGELLLTNGYFMKENPGMLLQLLRHMNELQCTGLAVKTRRFGLEIPDAVLQEAEKISFPIIEISSVEHSLGEILQRSTSMILDNRNDELQYALTIHKRFSSMIMKGDGIPEIIGALAQLLDSPVLLLGSKLVVTDYSEHFKRPQMHPLLEAAEKVLRGTSARQTAAQLCLLDPELLAYRHVELYPIHTYRHEGYLLAFQSKQAASNEYGLTLEQASNVISMELTKRQAVKERSRRYKNEFFADLLGGHITSEQEALHRGRRYGLKISGSWLLIAARQDETPANPLPSSIKPAWADERSISQRDVIYELIKRHLSLIAAEFRMFTIHDLFGILLFVGEGEWDEGAFLKGLGSVAEQLHEQSQLDVSFGVGKPVTSVLDLRVSFTEAGKALQYGYQLGRKRFVQSYRSKDINYLFRRVPSEELRQFYEETFQCFAALEEEERRELMRTLRVFYDTHCQLVETSKQLYVHRNTVIFRLDKCERLTGLKLKEPAESLRFRVAFAIERLLQTSGDADLV
ncbi:purine catabolism regulator [Paenibacillus phyllosphaerae]|uniref:Purine catabolism regulator n=1 Tax=Paenibacillus phyllosphaerae TaxID=274593 RepID=A0A7W5FR10_9BACL|nr:PucR family transcriptional regulator [Paenibacillus phyllosphaerae]MBB3113802.1 purine catabolism regulator [Paenibacillus phyllosphaerae]